MASTAGHGLPVPKKRMSKWSVAKAEFKSPRQKAQENLEALREFSKKHSSQYLEDAVSLFGSIDAQAEEREQKNAMRQEARKAETTRALCSTQSFARQQTMRFAKQLQAMKEEESTRAEAAKD